MGINWNEITNPTRLPILPYIPSIVLPTVFGDALTYTEQMGKINAVFNDAIKGMNNLAQNLSEVVLNTFKNAKIPIYGNLTYNNSEIFVPENWTLDNTQEVFEALQAGEMCILLAKCSFNDNGDGVYDENNNMMFILTQYNATNVDDTVVIDTRFISFDETNLRWVQVEFKVTTESVTSKILNIKQIELPNAAAVEALVPIIGMKVMVYKGTVKTPETEGSFIELTSNGTFVDLKDMFVIDENGSVKPMNICPCVTVDYRNGAIGVMKFGGLMNPWVRIYSTGFKIKSDNDTQISELSGRIDNNVESINDVKDNAVNMQRDIEEVTNTVGSLVTRTGELTVNSVSYTPQTKTDEQKTIARSNIGAVSESYPSISGFITINVSGTNLRVTPSIIEGEYVIGSNEPVVIRNVADPVINTDVANKRYVDNVASSGGNNVRYDVAQSLTNEQREIARNNIGAASINRPRFTGAISVEYDSNNVVSLRPTVVDGYSVLQIAGTSTSNVVRGVGTPVYGYDAANKDYVDSKYAETGSSVKYIPQSLSVEQKSQARSNIDAREKNDTDFDSFLNISASDDAIAGGEGGMALVHTAGDKQMTLMLNLDDGSVSFLDENLNLRPIKTAYAPDIPESAITRQEVTNRLTPMMCNINFTNNSWNVRDGNRPLALPDVVNQYQNGRRLITRFQVFNAEETGYGEIKCCGNGIGIICEIFDGTAWKRVTCNMNGTITTVVLT